MTEPEDDDEITVEQPDNWLHGDTFSIAFAGGVDAFCEAHKASALRVIHKDIKLEVMRGEVWVELGRAKLRSVKPDPGDTP